jgi:proton-translocating NADH-quinone oxidoreductase chain N
MKEQVVNTVESTLPVAIFILPLVAAGAIVLARRLSRWVWETAAVIGAIGTLGISAGIARAVLADTVLVAWGNQLRVDGLSALLSVLVGMIALIATVYSLRYMAHEQSSEQPVATNLGGRRLWVYYALLLLFVGTMEWGCVTNNVIVLYVAVEATTLASGLLVSFYWDKRALEAGYKYLMLLTVGLTFALFGCVLLYAAAAATGKITGSDALLLSELKAVGHWVPAGTAMITVAFLVVGFGTKAGIAPFHPWLPDAHAEAPTPISVLLSALMIKVAAYALARTVSIFYSATPALSVFVVAMGAFTMVVGIVMALAQDDLKRMLAFSSVSQMGYIVAGLGVGTYIGIYGGLFHLVNHTVFKSLLFLCVGALIYSTGGLRRISQMSGMSKWMPITGLCFFVGALSIGGLPPFNGFISKFTIFLALVDKGMIWAAVIGMITSLLTITCLVHAAYAVFWGNARVEGLSHNPGPKEVPVSMWAGMVFLASVSLLLGVFPAVIYPILDSATKCVLQIMGTS